MHAILLGTWTPRKSARRTALSRDACPDPFTRVEALIVPFQWRVGRWLCLIGDAQAPSAMSAAIGELP